MNQLHPPRRSPSLLRTTVPRRLIYNVRPHWDARVPRTSLSRAKGHAPPPAGRRNMGQRLWLRPRACRLPGDRLPVQRGEPERARARARQDAPHLAHAAAGRRPSRDPAQHRARARPSAKQRQQHRRCLVPDPRRGGRAHGQVLSARGGDAGGYTLRLRRTGARHVPRCQPRDLPLGGAHPVSGGKLCGGIGLYLRGGSLEKVRCRIEVT
ncbi:hypothetical protein CALCODRAFT_243298 [Calocera cornea HHB12733]|uniref:Uncharacterized protein n=1 Tax=Calocera cornea HHB12733 TaxID=1353952 RepID=A0A165GQC7_9BASI|nr:hypothetical protein CALCODRAFT_243298 [Calocera cornea HHB12733]